MVLPENLFFVQPIAYPYWDHSARTAVRNLLNTSVSGMYIAKVANVHDLKQLKQVYPSACIHHGSLNQAKL